MQHMSFVSEKGQAICGVFRPGDFVGHDTKGPCMNISANHLDQSEDKIIDVSHVGSRVKQARQSAGYSLEDLAETCGLTIVEISRIEDGVEIDLQHLKRIAPALQTSVEHFIEGNA